jgi:spore maturation protein CgeB
VELMKFIFFYHSLVSDWNHGNAHFLRGIVSELLDRGHHVSVYEPADGWSRCNLLAIQGHQPLADFYRAYPQLRLSSGFYDLESLDLNAALDEADVVLVHEWNAPELVARIGRHRAANRNYRLFFHDTHHRTLTAAAEMARFDLSHYDGVLAYGAVIRDFYLRRGWAQRAWVWHEAADTRVFYPRTGVIPSDDLVWIGNWGDNERTLELQEFLLKPAKALGLRTTAYGVRYPDHACQALADAGIHYGGWLANYRVPEVFARFRATLHIPRRPYAKALPGIPTIRPFEALACGIPLVSTPWIDSEGLFTPGKDFLVARNGREMQTQLRDLINDPSLAAELIGHGLATVLTRHTCSHRVDQLLHIVQAAVLPAHSLSASVPTG